MARKKMSWKRYRSFIGGHELDDLRQYVEEVHDALRASHKSLEKRVRKQMEGKTEDEAQEIANWYAEDDMKLGDLFPSLCSASTFVAVYTFLEHELIALCEHLHKRGRYPIGVQELAGQDYIDKAVTYLEKFCGVEKPKKMPQWAELKVMQRIRNIIVHKRGIVREARGNDNPDEVIRSYVEKNKSLKIDGVGTIVLSKVFCLHAVDLIRAFLMGVIEKLPDTEPNERER